MATVGSTVGVLALPTAAGAETAQFVADDSFEVPEDICTVHVTLDGARGGLGGNSASLPAPGARVTGTLTVTPGEFLDIEIGGAGGNGEIVGDGESLGGAGGAHGGAPGGTVSVVPEAGYAGGGGGGGATTILRAGAPLAVAGGGGGSGAQSNAAVGGGGTGGLILGGGPGLAGAGGATGGLGGNAAFGGAAGQDDDGNTTAFAGGPGIGGAGAGPLGYTAGGGGGGGGLFGGGGGGAEFDQAAAAGGGGGSSLVPVGGGVVLSQLVDGLVDITWDPVTDRCPPTNDGSVLGSAAADCIGADPVLVLSVTNNGDDPIVVDVLLDGALVPGGEALNVGVGATVDVDPPVPYPAGGAATELQVLDNATQIPLTDATAIGVDEPTCVDGTVEAVALAECIGTDPFLAISVTNNGDAPIVADVLLDGVLVEGGEALNVGVGATVEIDPPVPYPAGGAATELQVLDNATQEPLTLATAIGEDEPTCDDPEPDDEYLVESATYCTGTEPMLSIAITNEGDATAQIDVLVGGVEVITGATLDPGESTEVEIDYPAGGADTPVEVLHSGEDEPFIDATVGLSRPTCDGGPDDPRDPDDPRYPPGYRDPGTNYRYPTPQGARPIQGNPRYTG